MAIVLHSLLLQQDFNLIEENKVYVIITDSVLG